MAEFVKDSELTLGKASTTRCLHTAEWRLKGYAKVHELQDDAEYQRIFKALVHLQSDIKAFYALHNDAKED